MQVPRLTEASLCAICLAVLAAALIDLAWFHQFAFADRRLSDTLMQFHARGLPPDSDVVLIDIDDKSLDEMNPEFAALSLGGAPRPRRAS